MFLTADILLCHLVGDYLLQSDYMAQAKTQKSVPALLHALTYTLPFLCLTLSWKALLFIAVTHYLIDRYRLARYVCWTKNFLAPKWIEVDVPAKFASEEIAEAAGPNATAKKSIRNHPWAECDATGYHKDRPVWLSVWLLIITDNTLHLLCNAAALRWL